MRLLDSGLVLVRVVKQFGRNFPGQTAGFDPDLARKLVKDGLATFDTDEAPAGQPAGGAQIAISIPDDWKEMHHTRQIALAKNIAGDSAPENLTKQGAVAIIETELARRAAA